MHTKTFTFNKNTYTRLVKKRVKSDLKKSGKFVKFCNFLCKFIRVCAILAGIAMIAYIVGWSDYPYIDCILLILTTLFPYLLSFLPNAVVANSVGMAYKFEKNHMLSVVQGNLLYSVDDNHIGRTKDTVMIPLNKIEKIEYDEKLKLITINGVVQQEFYFNGEKINNTCYGFNFLDAYDEDILLFLKNNVSPYCIITVI